MVRFGVDARHMSADLRADMSADMAHQKETGFFGVSRDIFGVLDVHQNMHSKRTAKNSKDTKLKSETSLFGVFLFGFLECVHYVSYNFLAISRQQRDSSSMFSFICRCRNRWHSPNGHWTYELESCERSIPCPSALRLFAADIRNLARAIGSLSLVLHGALCHGWTSAMAPRGQNKCHNCCRTGSKCRTFNVDTFPLLLSPCWRGNFSYHHFLSKPQRFNHF